MFKFDLKLSNAYGSSKLNKLKNSHDLRVVLKFSNSAIDLIDLKKIIKSRIDCLKSMTKYIDIRAGFLKVHAEMHCV